MEINKELINLYENFPQVGTITASTTSLDERGKNCYRIQSSKYGSSDNERCTVLKNDFLEWYKFNNDIGGCFVLYEMKDKYKKLAEKHIKALEILLDDGHG